MRKILSYAVALSIALAAIAPPLGWNIPVMVNSFGWCYLVIVAGMLGFFLWFTPINPFFKTLSVYLFVSSFFSQSPYSSFNAYILMAVAFYFFLACKECDFEVICNILIAVFCFEVVLAFLQVHNMDKLLCFDRSMQLDPGHYDSAGKFIQTNDIVSVPGNAPKYVFMGTVMQYMRFQSLLAMMAPFLCIKNKLWIVPLLICAVFGSSLGFIFALAAGVMVYEYLTRPYQEKVIVFSLVFALCLVTGFLYRDHIRVEWIEGRIPIWWVIFKSWFLNTTGHQPWGHLSGPFDWQRFLVGHGMDTFLPLFPLYKHDMNPFGQAHNDWLQIPWEVGLIGASIFYAWAAWVCARLYREKLNLELAGCVCIAVNMFFCFPMRMTQTMLLMTAWAAYCEKRLHEIDVQKKRVIPIGTRR